MGIKEFMDLIEAQEVEEYPYGSCQYETVAKAYQATKIAGIENLAFLFDEDDYLDSMVNGKGKPQYLLGLAKLNLVIGYLRPNTNEEMDEQYLALEKALKEGTPIWEVVNKWLGEDAEDEDLQAEIEEIWEIKDYQELLDWAQCQSMDLWSMEIPVAWPELDKNVTPDVGEGPIFNMMAWEDGYRTGIQMAFMEYLCEEDFDWGEWDT